MADVVQSSSQQAPEEAAIQGQVVDNNKVAEPDQVVDNNKVAEQEQVVDNNKAAEEDQVPTPSTSLPSTSAPTTPASPPPSTSAPSTSPRTTLASNLSVATGASLARVNIADHHSVLISPPGSSSPQDTASSSAGKVYTVQNKVSFVAGAPYAAGGGPFSPKSGVDVLIPDVRSSYPAGDEKMQQLLNLWVG